MLISGFCVGPRVGARYAWRRCLELSKNGLSNYHCCLIDTGLPGSAR